MLGAYTYWYKLLFKEKSERYAIGGGHYKTSRAQLLKKLMRVFNTDAEEFLQIIKTVDGLMIQVIMSEPEICGFAKTPEGEVRPNWSLADSIMKSTFCLVILNRTNFMKKWKKQCKLLRKALLQGKFWENRHQIVMREFRWLYQLKVIRAAATERTGEENRLFLQRVTHLCSYRAGGLATPEMRRESFEKFKSVTTVDETGDEGFFTSGEIHSLMDGLFSRIPAKSRAFMDARADKLGHPNILNFSKITITNSGSLEGPVTKAGEAYGKAGFYRDHIRNLYYDRTKFEIFDLDTGQIICTRGVRDYLEEPDRDPFDFGEKYGSKMACNLGPNMGQLLYDYANYMLFTNQISRDVNLSIIAEAMKARTVSSGSVWLALAEYGYSHVLHEFCKIFPETKSGMSASNHAWNFYRSYIARPNEHRVVYDLQTATDFGPWSVGRSIFKSICGKLMLPPALTLKLADLAFSSRNVRSDYGDFSTKRGWPMGEPLTKPILTLAQLLVKQSVTDSIGYCSFVGDDGIGIWSTESGADQHLRNIPRMGMLLSDDDTWRSFNDTAFFCEAVIGYYEPDQSLPYETMQVWEMNKLLVRNRSADRQMAYVDYIPTRILNSVCPERKRHSGQSTGKVELLATRQSYNDGLGILVSHCVAPWLQRSILGRTNPADIIPASCLGRGLFEGYSNEAFFKARVPITQAIGAAIAARGAKTPGEEKYLFLYRLCREGFFKNHDRSLRETKPLHILEELYDTMVMSELLVQAPEGADRETMDAFHAEYIEFFDLCKSIISSYNESRFFYKESSVIEEDVEDPDKESEYLTAYTQLVGHEVIETAYQTVAEAAVKERKYSTPFWKLKKRISVGYVSRSIVRTMRVNWISTKVRMDGKLFPWGTPDRDSVIENIYRKAIDAVYWAMAKKNRNKTLHILREMKLSAAELSVVKAERSIGPPTRNSGGGGSPNVEHVGRHFVASASVITHSPDPWAGQSIFYERDPHSNECVISFLRIREGCFPNNLKEVCERMVGLYKPTTEGLLRISATDKSHIAYSGQEYTLDLGGDESNQGHIFCFIHRLRNLTKTSKRINSLRFKLECNPARSPEQLKMPSSWRTLLT
jgi:hypothetical protein